MNKVYKKALVLMNMGGARNKEEFEMFLRNMFNDKNILTIKSDLLRSMIASLIILSRKNSAWENYKLKTKITKVFLSGTEVYNSDQGFLETKGTFLKRSI